MGAGRYVRSARGEVLSMTNAEGEVMNYAYDFAGRMIRQESANDPDGEGPIGNSVTWKKKGHSRTPFG